MLDPGVGDRMVVKCGREYWFVDVVRMTGSFVITKRPGMAALSRFRKSDGRRYGDPHGLVQWLLPLTDESIQLTKQSMAERAAVQREQEIRNAMRGVSDLLYRYLREPDNVRDELVAKLKIIGPTLGLDIQDA